MRGILLLLIDRVVFQLDLKFGSFLVQRKFPWSSGVFYRAQTILSHQWVLGILARHAHV